ncbi:MAG TPA: PhzF family phenazine biosynthesis protein [Solirubrobacteraceae bacterium]|nr:PhzF family phenazine biosynthesis protein [Solirubrobacteraceae bacterium]
MSVIPDRPDWLGGADSHRYLVVDVFTPRPLQGNQLGVFLDGRRFDSDTMLRLTRELEFAETVFLLPPEAGGDVRVRIFTPGGELPFAGHPVLGTAFVVGSALEADRVVLETGAGAVPLELERDPGTGRIVFGRMQQPLPTCEPFDRAEQLLAAVGVERSLLPIEIYRNGPEHAYIALESEDAVASLRPNMELLRDLGVGANCFAGSGGRWKTRMFYPGFGVDEDAATGSAAGPLTLHLARHGAIAFGDQIEIRQGEEINRPSLLYGKVTGSVDAVESIEVGGGAQIVASGEYRTG